MQEPLGQGEVETEPRAPGGSGEGDGVPCDLRLSWTMVTRSPSVEEAAGLGLLLGQQPRRDTVPGSAAQ